MFEFSPLFIWYFNPVFLHIKEGLNRQMVLETKVLYSRKYSGHLVSTWTRLL